MEYIIIIIISIILILLLKLILDVKISRLSKYKDDKNLLKLTDKFPKNVELTKEILKELNNEKSKVKENVDSGTSLYVALTDTITISSNKNSCARIQTIAHECAHSVQNRKVHISNFLISNIYLVYFVFIVLVIAFKLVNNPAIYILILAMLGFAQFAIRAYLEVDAMTKAKYIAKEYMEKKQILEQQEVNKLCEEYDKINSMTIPFYVWKLFSNNAIKIIICAIVALI